MFRGFNTLRALNLLRLQTELQELEDELEHVFQGDRASQVGERNKYGRSFSHMRAMAETSDTRQLTLLATIGDELEKYRKLNALFPVRPLTLNDGEDALLKQILLMNEATRPTESAQEFLGLWIIRDNLGGNFLERSGIEAKV
jgi:hypothetical protein